MIPGLGNILPAALGLVGRQTVLYARCNGSAQNRIAATVLTFDTPIPLSGSVQPIPSTSLKMMGLDLTKTYVTFFVSQGLAQVGRDQNPDRFKFNNKWYQVVSLDDWIPTGGYSNPIAVLMVPQPTDAAMGITEAPSP